MKLALLALLFLLPSLAVDVPGTSVSLDPPEGMTPSSRFAGFENRAEGVSILVTELPAPVSQALAGLRNPEKLAGQGMKLLDAAKVELASGPAELLHYSQRASGTEYTKWSLVLGDDRGTVIVSATCEQKLEDKWAGPLRKSLESTRRTARTPAASDMRVEPRGGFRQVPNVMTGSVAYTIGGVFPLRSPSDPLFILSRSVSPVPVSSLQEFAAQRARQLPGCENLKVSGIRAVQIDGLDGAELEGVCDSRVIYEAVLRDPAGGYYLLVGTGPSGEESRLVPVFREMGASFRRK